MNILALIPARGGSKGIPRKNIAPLGGRPLIDWTIGTARQTPDIGRIIVSTDDDDIAEVARRCGAEVPFLRPSDLASDTAAALPVIRHAVETLERLDGWHTDAVAYLQPTSPFRTPADLTGAITRMKTEHADTVVSVVRVPHNMHASSLMRGEPDGSLSFTAPPEERRFRRQDKTCPLFARNGPAILLLLRSIIDRGELYGDRILPWEMDALHSLDIDEPMDLAMAEAMVPLVSGSNKTVVHT